MTARKRAPRLSKQAAVELFQNSLPDAIAAIVPPASTDIVDWAHGHFFVNPGEPIALRPHQAAVLRLFTERDAESGEHRWRTIVYSTVKKSGKTALAALLTRFEVETGPPRREIYLAANDREQATNRVFQAIRHSIELDPTAEAHWVFREHELRHRSGTFVRAIPADYRGEAGSNPSLTVWTELWGFEHESHVRLFEELTPVPTTDSVRLVETSAGYEGESGLLGRLHELGKEGHQLTAGELAARTGAPLDAFAEADTADALLPVWLNEAAAVAMYWDEGVVARRMPWQQGPGGEAYYREQAETLRPSQFRRLHVNEWAQAEEAFVPIEWWDACREDLPALGPDEQVVIGVDAAVSGDCFAIVGVTRYPSDARSQTHAALRYVRLWTPPRGGVIDFAEPYAAMLDLIKRYHVEYVAYDPYQLHEFMRRLQGEVTVWAEPFPQGNERYIADKLLQDLIRERRLIHDGDPSAREHMLNAVASLSGDSRLRIEKRTERAKVDIVVALSMAVEQCFYFALDRPTWRSRGPR